MIEFFEWLKAGNNLAVVFGVLLFFSWLAAGMVLALRSRLDRRRPAAGKPETPREAAERVADALYNEPISRHVVVHILARELAARETVHGVVEEDQVERPEEGKIRA